MLLALLLAVAVGVAGWAGFLALRRDAPAARAMPPIAPLVAPPQPQRLPAASGFERAALPAAAARENTARPLEIHLRALPAALRALGEAGVATFAVRTGADFAWRPLADAVTNADGSLTLRSSTRVRGEVAVTLATAPAWARHSYLTRTTIDLASTGAGKPVSIELSASAAPVRLTLPAASLGTGPLRLARADDAQWLPSLHAATGIAVLPGAPTELLLGAGIYDLIDPVDASRRQRFEVPRTDPVVLTPALTQGRVDRP